MSRARPSGLLLTTVLAGLVGASVPSPARAISAFQTRDPICAQPRGAEVATALLVEFYEQFLPQLQRRKGDALQHSLAKFQKMVAERYSEGTLQRLCDCPNAKARQAAVLALGLMGTMASNETLAGRLHDDDEMVRQMAYNALWSLWFRGDTEANNAALQRLLELDDRDKALAGLDALIKKAPKFAEAYNQRAIIHFRKRDYEKSIADCEKVLQLNPYHFGALSGMAQCYIALHKPRAALKCFRNLFRINPYAEGTREAIRALEEKLGEEGKKDDRK
jgi:tetratricopeptide (TPR) repeat protein